MRAINKLSAKKIAAIKNPGAYGDGLNLWLRVDRQGNKSWAFRFMRNGKARWAGLGSLHAISLGEARERAADCRNSLARGLDPIELKKKVMLEGIIAAGNAKTFGECARGYLGAHEHTWRNPKHRAQWHSTLATYVYPTLEHMAVAQINVGHVLAVIEPIWRDKTETANRIRQRIEAILDWASARGYRSTENPARWRGHLDKLLPSRTKTAPVKHRPAMPYGQLPSFISELRRQKGTAARALEYAILTAARTSEVRLAVWGELAISEMLWTIPAERMKAQREHRVPLSKHALAVVNEMSEIGEFVFAGGIGGKPLSENAMLEVLSRIGLDQYTVHGFRSTFRDWAAEMTDFPREVAEMALAHTIRDDVEAAYRRGDLFEKRRLLMTAWSEFCGSAENVVALRRAS